MQMCVTAPNGQCIRKIDNITPSQTKRNTKKMKKKHIFLSIFLLFCALIFDRILFMNENGGTKKYTKQFH